MARAAGPRRDAGPAGNIPMHVQLGGGIAATIVGTARGAWQHSSSLATAKRPTGNSGVLADRSFAQMAVGEGEGLLLAAEDTLAAGAATSGTRAARGQPFTVDDRIRLRLRMVTAARLGLRAVDLVHDAAGMSGVRRPGPRSGGRDAGRPHSRCDPLVQAGGGGRGWPRVEADPRSAPSAPSERRRRGRWRGPRGRSSPGRCR